MKIVKMRFSFLKICSFILLMQLFTAMAYAATATNIIAPNITSMGQFENPTTLWQVLKAGGGVMIVIGFLSLVGLAIIVYDIMTLNVNKLAPQEFFEEVIRKLEDSDLKNTRDLCVKEKNNIIAKIILAGLDKAKKNSRGILVREAMEHRARIEIGSLWQNLNYLSDIVAVAPLLGLLGTVLGMIQAFHAVPLSGTAKTSLLAAGIAKAMIATASGLIVAIPVLMAYSYFRGKVQEVTNVIELYTTDIIRVMEKDK